MEARIKHIMKHSANVTLSILAKESYRNYQKTGRYINK